MKIYLDGASSNQKTSSLVSDIYDSGSVDVRVGHAPHWGGSGSTFFNGNIDEVRLSKTVRNADWISTCYANIHNLLDFIELGSEEVGAYPDEPVLSDESPTDGAVNVGLNPQLSVFCVDFQGDLMTVTFRTNATGSWSDVGSNVSVGNGTYSCC